jgi:hypothetical protein
MKRRGGAEADASVEVKASTRRESEEIGDNVDDGEKFRHPFRVKFLRVKDLEKSGRGKCYL